MATDTRSAEITAAYIASSGLLNRGWDSGVTQHNSANSKAWPISSTAWTPYRFSRKGDIVPLSLYNAIWWERSQLKEPRMLSTPALPEYEFFKAEKPHGVGRVEKEAGGRMVYMHGIWALVQQSEYTLPLKQIKAWTQLPGKLASHS